jgi:D-aminopeptidase
MHALILADLEGVIGVYDLSDLDECSKLYTKEISVYVNTLIETGCSRITVCDIHDNGDLINQKKVSKCSEDVEIEFISQVSGLSFHEQYDYAIMVGFHGMEGSPGVIPHTIRGDIKKNSLRNNKNARIEIGEVELYSRWLGSFGVPVILVTGDREATYEGNCFNAYRQTCCIKCSLQLNEIIDEILYKKAYHNIRLATRLEKDLCLSKDDCAIAIEFENTDVVDYMETKGFTRCEESVVFSDCRSFVDDIVSFMSCLNEAREVIWNTNMAFLRELRAMASYLKKEDVATSSVGSILRQGLLQLDKMSRNEVRVELNRMEGVKKARQKDVIRSDT